MSGTGSDLGSMVIGSMGYFTYLHMGYIRVITPIIIGFCPGSRGGDSPNLP